MMYCGQIKLSDSGSGPAITPEQVDFCLQGLVLCVSSIHASDTTKDPSNKREAIEEILSRIWSECPKYFFFSSLLPVDL